MGAGCDMFYYNHDNQECKFMPHNPIKGRAKSQNELATLSKKISLKILWKQEDLNFGSYKSKSQALFDNFVPAMKAFKT